jgi:hypothetical protein
MLDQNGLMAAYDSYETATCNMVTQSMVVRGDKVATRCCECYMTLVVDRQAPVGLQASLRRCFIRGTGVTRHVTSISCQFLELDTGA